METTQTKLRCNRLGTPYQIQSIEQWQAHVKDAKNEYGLSRLRRELNTGNGLFAAIHPFVSGSEEFFAAHRALREHATFLGWEWHKGYFKYVKI